MKRTISLVFFMVFFAGCATHELSAELQNELNAPLYCEGEKQCKTMWERATFFVNKNAGFKLQVHNDTVIQTFNPSEHSPKLAFSISKEPIGNDRYQITIEAWCANIFGCNPDHLETIARGKLYLRTGRR